jgi:hypothetical protein
MEHKQYDRIKLKDGREGTIVEVLYPMNNPPVFHPVRSMR